MEFDDATEFKLLVFEVALANYISVLQLTQAVAPLLDLETVSSFELAEVIKLVRRTIYSLRLCIATKTKFKQLGAINLIILLILHLFKCLDVLVLQRAGSWLHSSFTKDKVLSHEAVSEQAAIFEKLQELFLVHVWVAEDDLAAATDCQILDLVKFARVEVVFGMLKVASPRSARPLYIQA